LADLSKIRVSDQHQAVYGNGLLWPMVFVAIVYAVLIAAGILMEDRVSGLSLFCLSYPVAIATFGLSAAWSVFGVGGILRRWLVASSLATIVFLGFSAGIFISEHLGVSFFSSSNVPIHVLFCFTCLAFVQIPFWILRAATGSHWCFESNKVKPLISLRDLFFVVLLFSLAMSASQWETNQLIASARASVEIGTVYFIIPSSLTLPVFWWVFRCKRLRTSVLLMFVYSLGVTAAFVVFFVSMGGKDQLNLEVVAWTGGAAGLSMFLVWAPLVLMKKSGLVFRTKNHLYDDLVGP